MSNNDGSNNDGYACGYCGQVFNKSTQSFNECIDEKCEEEHSKIVVNYMTRFFEKNETLFKRTKYIKPLTGDKLLEDNSINQHQEGLNAIPDLNERIFNASNKEKCQQFRSMMVNSNLSNLSKTVFESTEQIREINEKIKVHEREVKKLSQDIYGVSSQVRSLQQRIIPPEIFKGQKNIWRIKAFENLRAEYIKNDNVKIYERFEFVIGENGYKFQARLYLNGDGIGQDTYLSLELKHLKFDYDDFLEWPFTYDIKFSPKKIRIADPEAQDYTITIKQSQKNTVYDDSEEESVEYNETFYTFFVRRLMPLNELVDYVDLEGGFSIEISSECPKDINPISRAFEEESLTN